MGLIDPVPAIIISFCALGLMLYKRVHIGITLNLTALLLAFLSLELKQIPTIIYETSVDLGTISAVFATFGIMLMSQLYKETQIIGDLSESLSRIVNNSKLVVSMLPAAIGLLPVPGGALMSAPLVEVETEKLGLKADKKTYVNVWFRHTIFPVYPISQILILTATLTGLTVTSIITRQIPVVISMIVIGYVIGLWKTASTSEREVKAKKSQGSAVVRFLITFSPILATILGVVGLGIDVSIAAFLGVFVLLLVARPNFKVFQIPFRSWAIYGITFAVYGAFLLRNVIDATGLSEVFGAFVAGGGVDNVVLLILVPAGLSFLVGSPLAGIAISYSILEGIVNFNVKSAGLLYISSYLGYVIAPTHLCLVLTADYFKCSLGRLYKYFIPSLAVSFGVAMLMYFLV